MTGAVERILDTTQQLLAVPAVVGAEAPLLDWLTTRLQQRPGIAVRRDRDVVVATGGTRPVLLSAHIDRHGLTVISEGRVGYAAHVLASRRGRGPAPRHAFAETVCSRFADEPLVAYDPISGAAIARGVARHAGVCGIADLGVEVEVEGLEDLPHGTPIAFDGRCEMTDLSVAGQLDNALTAAIALVVLEDGFDGTVAFTAEEEVGNSWRPLLAAVTGAPTSPAVVVLDTSPFADHAAPPPGSVVLRRRDANAAFDPALVAALLAACERRDIGAVIKDEIVAADNVGRAREGRRALSLGSTELGRVIAAGDGTVRGATLQVPTTGYHTNSETAALASVAAVDAVLRDTIEAAGSASGR